MSRNQHYDDFVDLSGFFTGPPATAGAAPPVETGLSLRLEQDGNCTIYPVLGETLIGPFTGSAIQALDLAAIDHHIRYWQRKAASAPDAVCRAVAEGHVSALQTVRVIHGLGFLEVG